MKKRILSVLITLVMLIGLVTVMSVSASAAGDHTELSSTEFTAVTTQEELQSAATSNEVHYAVVYDKTDDKIYLYLGNSAHVVADDEVVQYDCQGYFTEERGDCYGSNFNIVKVIIESPIAPTSCKRLFQGLTACEKIEGIEKLDTSRATSMEGMFASCFKLYNPNVSGFDTSNVTDMSGMFTSCKAITKLDLSNFDTSKVTDMSNMFVACHGLATELNLSSFIIGENTNTQDMFLHCNPVNTIKTPKINEKADIELPKGDYTPYALYGSVAGTEGSNMMPVTDGASITIGRQVIATLDNNGIGIPDMPETKTVFLGIPYGELPTTKETKEGYTFYWTTELGVNQGANLISNDTKVVNAINHKIYACWEPNKYTVTVDANDGNTAPTTIEVKYNGYYYNLPKVTREGYTFIGWYTEPEDGDKINTSKCTIAANHTIYAHWVASCTVSFDANGGNDDPASMTVVPGETYGTLPTPTRTGYDFVGWYTAKSDGDKVTKDTTVTETKDHTLYAQWKARIYGIYLYNNYTNTDKSHAGYIQVTYGKKYGENNRWNGYLPKPSCTGYTFVGWFTAREGGTEITANSTVTGSDDLYAHWKLATYSVTFNNEGHGTAPDKQYVTYGNKATKPEDPTEEGWIFGGWYTSRSFKTEFDFDTIISDYTDLYAKWTPAHTHSYTYTASGNVITEACTCGHEETATINAPTGNLTYDGTEKVATVAYSEGWLGGELTVSYEPGNVEAGAVTASITMGDATATVAFTIEKSTYTVTFIVNGGEISDDDVISNYTYGVGATLPIPTREGYTFLGWYADEEYSGEAVTAIGATDTGDKTFYAKWEETVARYDLWVGGVQVTDANKANIVVPGATGSATYDPDTKTLTLENFKFEGAAAEIGSYSCAVLSAEDITIVLVGENSLINTNDTAYCAAGIYGVGSVEIIGNGTASLYVESVLSIEASGVLSINGVDLEAKASGDWSALCGKELEILDSKVIVTTTNALHGEGMGAVDTITIKGSDVTVTSNYKAVISGEVSIIDSTVTLNSKQYSIDADGDIEIKNSTFNASIPDNDNYLEMSVIMTDGNVLIEKSTANITTGETTYSSYGIQADTVTFDNSIVTLDTASGACKTTNGVTVTNVSVYDDDSQVDAPDASTYSGNYVKLVPLLSVTVNYGIDGIENKVITISRGDKVTLDNPLFYGYIFMGWFADEDFTTAFDFTTPITVDTIIYAKLVNYEDDKTELENALTALQNAVENKADAATVNTAIANLQAAIDALEAVKNNYAAADSALKTELEEKITAAQDAAINAATTLVNNAKAELQTAINAKADAATVNTAIANLQAAIDALEAVKNNYAAADSVLKTELEEKITAAKSELEALISNIQSELDAAKAKLDKAIADLNKAIANGDKELSDEIAALDAALADVKAALEKADADNKAELTEKIDTAESSLKAAVDALSNELNATNENVAKLKKLIIACTAFLVTVTVVALCIVKRKKG